MGRVFAPEISNSGVYCVNTDFLVLLFIVEWLIQLLAIISLFGSVVLCLIFSQRSMWYLDKARLTPSRTLTAINNCRIHIALVW